MAAAEVEKSAQQFSYMDGDDFVFMNMETFEETKLPSTEVPKDYIVEGSEVRNHPHSLGTSENWGL